VSQSGSIRDTEVRKASGMCRADNILADMNPIQLLHRFESEKSFSFTSTDNIHSVAVLLEVSHCNHFKDVDSLSSFIALPLRSSRTTVRAPCERI
jgi:hypothetical protein